MFSCLQIRFVNNLVDLEYDRQMLLAASKVAKIYNMKHVISITNISSI